MARIIRHGTALRRIRSTPIGHLHSAKVGLLNRDAAKLIHHSNLDVIHHLFKKRKSLALVLLLRIFLRITAKRNRLPQSRHRRQVGSPKMVDLSQIIILRQFHEQIFARLPLIRTIVAEFRLKRRHEVVELLDLVIVLLLDDAPNQLQLRHSIPATNRRKIGMHRHSHDVFQCLEHFGHIPIFIRHAFGQILIGILKHDIFEVVQYRVFQLLAFQYIVTQTIDRFALRIHHVVVFEQILSNVEVAPLDSLLRRLDRTRYEARLDRNIRLFVHPKHRHAILELFAAKDAQQIVVQRQEKSARTGVALAPCTPAQLIVDATRLVTLRPQDKQSPRFLHLCLLSGALRLELLQQFRIPRIRLIAIASLTRQKLGVTTQQNVRAATRHIRRYRHRSLAPRLRDDLCLALVVLRIQHVMRYPKPIDRSAKHLALLDAHRTDQYRLTFRMALLDLFRYRLDLHLLIEINDVLIILANDVLRRRNAHHIELVNLLKLLGFRICRTRHTGEFIVHSKIILERNRRERLAFGLDFDTLFRLYRLVQTIRPTTPIHHAPRKVVDDDDLPILDHVVLV